MYRNTVFLHVGADTMTSSNVKNRYKYEFERDVSIIDALIRNHGQDIHQKTVHQYKQDYYNNNVYYTLDHSANIWYAQVIIIFINYYYY
jgi:hypothetical protein